MDYKKLTRFISIIALSLIVFYAWIYITSLVDIRAKDNPVLNFIVVILPLFATYFTVCGILEGMKYYSKKKMHNLLKKLKSETSKENILYNIKLLDNKMKYSLNELRKGILIQKEAEARLKINYFENVDTLLKEYTKLDNASSELKKLMTELLSKIILSKNETDDEFSNPIKVKLNIIIKKKYELMITTAIIIAFILSVIEIMTVNIGLFGISCIIMVISLLGLYYLIYHHYMIQFDEGGMKSNHAFLNEIEWIDIINTAIIKKNSANRYYFIFELRNALTYYSKNRLQIPKEILEIDKEKGFVIFIEAIESKLSQTELQQKINTMIKRSRKNKEGEKTC